MRPVGITAEVSVKASEAECFSFSTIRVDIAITAHHGVSDDHTESLSPTMRAIQV